MDFWKSILEAIGLFVERRKPYIYLHTTPEGEEVEVWIKPNYEAFHDSEAMDRYFKYPVGLESNKVRGQLNLYKEADDKMLGWYGVVRDSSRKIGYSVPVYEVDGKAYYHGSGRVVPESKLKYIDTWMNNTQGTSAVFSLKEIPAYCLAH